MITNTTRRVENIMLAFILILLFFLPLAVLPCTLDTFFSCSELIEMGIFWDRIETAKLMLYPDAPANSLHICI
jgi:hypothetical protein